MLQSKQQKMIFIVVMVACLSQVNGKSHCVGTCYSGRLFPETQETFHGKHLKGHSYKNITSDNPVKCYHHCAQDCRCKACQMKDAKCELLDEDKTSKANDFKDEPGYVHFDLKQTMYQGESHMVPAGVSCYNGCCRSQPCMNGGTCVEQCKSPKEKFTCKCPYLVGGKVCEIIQYSCLSILKSAPAGTLPNDGVYNVTRKKKVPVAIALTYCDFEHPNIAWTLIESFSRDNNIRYQRKAFHQGYSQNVLNEQDIRWDNYRAGGPFITQTHADNSIMFRATCDFPNRNGVLKPDYLFGYLSDYDIVKHGDLSVDGECKKYSYINIRGQEFHNATMPTWHRKDASHLHIGYPLHRSPWMCNFQPVQDAKDGEACFGYYGVYHPQFKCTETGSSTTQWWLGGKI